MSKFTKSEMKKSLLESISLVFKPFNDEEDFQWVEYNELEDVYREGYILFNEQKREHFEKNCTINF